MTTPEVAAGLARTWVGFYTRRVNGDAAQRRRAEIASDLWEQQAEAERTGTPSWRLALSITCRVLAGMMADVVWAHSQRMARQRVLALGGVAGRWWRAVAATLLSAFYLFLMVQNLPEYGLRSAQVPIASVALLAAGTMLRPTAHRTAAAMVVLGAAPATLAWWAPGLTALAILTIIGVITETFGLTIRGRAARVLAGLAIATLVFASFGTLLAGWGYYWPAAGFGSVAVLAFTGRRRPRPS